MSRKDALFNKGVRGKNMLLKLGLDLQSSITKSDAPSPFNQSPASETQAECTKYTHQKSRKNDDSCKKKINFTVSSYDKKSKAKVVKKILPTSISHNNPKKRRHDNWKKDSDENFQQLMQAGSSTPGSDNITYKNSIISTKKASVEEDLKLLELFSVKKYNGSLSLSDLTQDDMPKFTRKFRKRSQSVPFTFRFIIQDNNHDNSDLTVGSESDDAKDDNREFEVQPSTHDKSVLTVCNELKDTKSFGVHSVAHVATVRSLSLNDLTEDKTSDIRLVRKCQSAVSLFQEISSIAHPSSPSLLFFYQNESFPDNDDQNYQMPNHENLSEDTDCVDFGDPSEGRKRHSKGDPTQWKKNIAKRQRMSGEAYLGYSKVQGHKVRQDTYRPSRELGPSCNSDFCKKSKIRGCQRFTDQMRKDIHNRFWKKLNWDSRKMYVAGFVSRAPTSRKTKAAGENSKRENTLSYFLPLKNSGHEEKVQVCREMFLSTLSLGRFTVQEWVKKSEFGIVPSKENRTEPVNKSKPPGVTKKLLTLDNFLDNIPKLPSHYARKETTKLFIEPNFSTVSELYKNYKEYCAINEENPVCRFTFDKKFEEKNLSLYTLKKDMCDICSSYKAGNSDEAEYQIHCIKKDRARKEKEEDKKKAANGEIILLTMDLEAVKVCPFLTASALYFKTKLTCYNFTVYDLVTHHCSCYWFNETDADLTSSTFASFIIDYLERHCLQRKLPIVIFSDGCTYQNRNIVLSNALLNFSCSKNVKITQKFLEPGHTQMECDSVHSAIERKLKNKEIYLPSDYVKLTKEARAKKPYETIVVDYNFVKNYADPKTYVYKSIRPGKKAGDDQVVDLRQIMYMPDCTIKIALDFDSDLVDLPQRPRSRAVSNVVYSQLHTSRIPIKKTKYDHLQQLKTVLPPDCHHFYDSLPYLN